MISSVTFSIQMVAISHLAYYERPLHEKLVNDFNRQFTKEEIHTANKQKNVYPPSVQFSHVRLFATP